VLYKHFSSTEGIAAGLAIDAFGEFADALRAARTSAGTSESPLAPNARIPLFRA
jgi:hypothetical protein